VVFPPELIPPNARAGFLAINRDSSAESGSFFALSLSGEGLGVVKGTVSYTVAQDEPISIKIEWTNNLFTSYYESKIVPEAAPVLLVGTFHINSHSAAVWTIRPKQLTPFEPPQPAAKATENDPKTQLQGDEDDPIV